MILQLICSQSSCIVFLLALYNGCFWLQQKLQPNTLSMLLVLYVLQLLISPPILIVAYSNIP